MLTYQEIHDHLNRPPDQLMKELSRIRYDHCQKIDKWKKSYPLRKWLGDLSNCVAGSSVAFNFGVISISIQGAAVEDVIEFIAGPIHRRFNCFWRLTHDTTVDLHSIKSIPIQDSTYKFPLKIYIFEVKDCELKTTNKRVVRDETIYHMDCKAEV